jgi:membrane protein YdbS with pleckstrin-like domain
MWISQAQPASMAVAQAETTHAASRLSDLPFHRRLLFWLSAGLVLLAGVFYFLWGVYYHGWLDNGVYAVTIVPLLFGLVGMWLILPNRPAPAPPPRS